MLKEAKPSETAEQICLKEGVATQGVWEPIAMAEITMVLIGIWRDLRGDKEMKVPTMSKVLRGWALPFLSEAMAAEEKDQEALAIFESVKRLAKKVNKDV